MKLKFGKKTLALLLMLTVALSLCTVSAWADEVAVNSVTASAGNTNLFVGESTTITATVSPEGAPQEVTCAVTSGDAVTVSGTTVKAVKAGSATVTVTTVGKQASETEGAEGQPATATVSFTVSADTIKIAENATVDVPYGADDTVLNARLKAAEIAVTYESGKTGTVTTDTWTAKSGFSKTAEVGTEYTYTAALTNLSENVVQPTLTVTVVEAEPKAGTSDSINVGTVTVLKGTKLADVVKLLEKSYGYYPLTLNNGDTKNFGIGSTTGSGSTFVAGCYEAWATNIEGTAYNESYANTYTFTAKAKTNANYNLPNLTCTVESVSSAFTLKADDDYKAVSLSSLAEKIDTLLKNMYGEGLESIDFDDISGKGGSVYIKESDGTLTQVGEEYYSLSEFKAMYFYPNGSGKDVEIEYTAYIEDKDDYFEGLITLESGEFILLTDDTVALTTDELYQFDASDILDAIDAFDGSIDADDVAYVKFSEIPASNTEGYLYYGEYEEDSKSNTKVTTSKTFYVDPSKSSQLELDEFTFVPGKAADVTIVLKAYKTASKSVTVVIRLSVTEEADIIVSTAKNTSVDLSLDDFQEYLEANVSKSKKDYIPTHIVFEDAPHSKTAGYLYAGSKKLTSPNGKEFALDEDYKGDYDFDELSYMGGSKDTSTRATFTIYGKKTANAKTTYVLLTGTVDFVTGDVGSTTQNITGSIVASQVMPFSNKINVFLDVQSDMDYMVFTDLPRTGKLVYNWGVSGQTDVNTNIAYYISGTNKLLLKNITFVPGYTSAKSSNTVTFGYKAVSTKGKTVTGTFTITVSHAYASARFNDVTSYVYADSVDFLYNQKITTGTSATTFNPNGQVTRKEFVTFLYRAAGSPSVTGLTNRFTDVSATTHSYYYNAILWAAANGITTGTSATTFNPDGLVRHDELLTFLYRYDVKYLGHAGGSAALGAYSGWSSVADWAQTGAKWAAYKSILTTSDSTTPPATNGTRATVALWLHRMLTL